MDDFNKGEALYVPNKGRKGSDNMAREDAVLNMQLTLVPILADAWNMSLPELSEVFRKYDVPGYINVCYENYNSTGNQGIIDDLKDYIQMQGGSIG